ncbi:DUF4180 domain-containing protein [Actinomadura darangshiensis]|uniref:DUF4180 domain-containing protein n=1 Tax=Actinomadura darangshiensis TaxID=705336 RepID=A0A4R5BMR1_9ACTN|nr:DUF4180 domain-containing protein [Actinomadura darangshiensis]TDD87205.1 DUF4180 domain-containing protein [Actinomadura darangshiensis]
MPDVLQERAGVAVLVCDPDGPPVATVDDALDLIGAAFLGAEAVAAPASRLDERFFALGTRFANYRLRLAVIGDISRHAAASPALRALVRESNAGGHVRFVPDLDALDARLAAVA